jgi:hypothetical protein
MSRRCALRQIKNSPAIGGGRSSVRLPPAVVLTFPSWASFPDPNEERPSLNLNPFRRLVPAGIRADGGSSNKTKENKSMNSENTPNLYTSPDGLITIRILDNPKRWPQHDYKCVVVRAKPHPHERVRVLDDGTIEAMYTKQDLLFLVLAFQKADPDFGVQFTQPMENKPEHRKAKWKQINRRRISQGRFYRTYRSGRRH